MVLVPPGAPLARRLAVLCAALVVLATGISSLLSAGFGAAPYDVLTTGVAHGGGMPLWIAATVVAGACMVVGLALGERPGVGTLVCLVAAGPLIGTFVALMPEPEALVARGGLFTVGVLLTACGITGVVVSGAGNGPVEMTMVALADRPLPLAATRLAMEVVFVISGALMGGAVGVGTLVFALVIGPLLRRLLAAAGWRSPAADAGGVPVAV